MLIDKAKNTNTRQAVSPIEGNYLGVLPDWDESHVRKPCFTEIKRNLNLDDDTVYDDIVIYDGGGV